MSINDPLKAIYESNSKLEQIKQSIRNDIKAMKDSRAYMLECIDADKKRYDRVLELYKAAEAVLSDVNKDLLIRAFATESNRMDLKLYDEISASLTNLWIEESKLFNEMSEFSDYSRKFVQRILLESSFEIIKQEIRYAPSSEIRKVLSFAKVMILISEKINLHSATLNSEIGEFNIDLAFHLKDATLSALALFFLDSVYEIVDGKISSNKPNDLIVSLMMILAQAQEEWAFDFSFTDCLLSPISDTKSISFELWPTNNDTNESVFFDTLATCDVSYDCDFIDPFFNFNSTEKIAFKGAETKVYPFVSKINETIEAVFLRLSLMDQNYRNRYAQQVFSELSAVFIKKGADLSKNSSLDSIIILANSYFVIADFITMTSLSSSVSSHITSMSDPWFKESFLLVSKISKMTLNSLSKQLATGLRLITSLITGKERVGDIKTAFSEINKSSNQLDSLFSSLRDKSIDKISVELNDLLQKELITLLSRVTGKSVEEIDLESIDKFVDAVQGGVNQSVFDITQFNDLVKIINDPDLRKDIEESSCETQGLLCKETYARSVIKMLS